MYFLYYFHFERLFIIFLFLFSDFFYIFPNISNIPKLESSVY